jgi:hypothetical protein
LCPEESLAPLLFQRLHLPSKQQQFRFCLKAPIHLLLHFRSGSQPFRCEFRQQVDAIFQDLYSQVQLFQNVADSEKVVGKAIIGRGYVVEQS